MRIAAVVLLVVVLAMAWIRLAPSDPAVWHQQPEGRELGDHDAAGGFEAVRRIDDAGALAALQQVILATPRTRLLAGSIEDGLATYVTRSRIVGFPDYTTVAVRDDVVSIRGRLRFGRSDLGVNRARIVGWLKKVDGFSGP